MTWTFLLTPSVPKMIFGNLRNFSMWYLTQIVDRLKRRETGSALRLFVLFPIALWKAGIVIPFFVKWHVDLGAFLC